MSDSVLLNSGDFVLFNDGTIKILEIGKSLTAVEKAQIVAQYPELAGKEIGE